MFGLWQDIGVKDNRFCYRYVVVFQYGSAVLSNIADHEAEYYLDIIRKNASRWLPEMRKDDKDIVSSLCKTMEEQSYYTFEENVPFAQHQLLKDDLKKATINASGISESFDSFPYYLRVWDLPRIIGEGAYQILQCLAAHPGLFITVWCDRVRYIGSLQSAGIVFDGQRYVHC